VYVKNTFVGETQGQYPKNIAFAVMGEDKFAQMGIVVGGTYNVSFDVESREWKGKWFTEASAWRAQRIDGDGAQVQQQSQEQEEQSPIPQQSQSSPSSNTSSNSEDNADDLPF
jgi:hypothetical protein